MSFAAIFITAMVVLFYALGILVLRGGIGQIRDGLGARGWPTTNAVLESCTVARRRANNGPVYYVAAKYSYAVEGVRYTGDTVAIGYESTGDRKAHEMAQRRVLNMDRFSIRYHPEKPEMSTIFASGNSLVYGTFVVGVVWLTFTTCFALLVLAISGVGRTILAWFG
jgi:hypothetical protein